MDAAANLTGAARAKAYQKLDFQIMQKYAPWVPYAIVNGVFFTSNRTKNYVYSSYFGEPIFSTLRRSRAFGDQLQRPQPRVVGQRRQHLDELARRGAGAQLADRRRPLRTARSTGRQPRGRRGSAATGTRSG